jgi:hypothetical protein
MIDFVELQETTKCLLELEDTVYPPIPFPFGNPLSDIHHDEPLFDGTRRYTPAWLEDSRTRICNWMFQVVDHCRQPRDVVCVAMYFLDTMIRYMVDQRNEPMFVHFEYMCGTVFYLALKCHGVDTERRVDPAEIFPIAAIETREGPALR